MDRELFQSSEGFTFGKTELKEIVANKDGCHEGAAWADLDSDGCIDLVAIETTNGHDESDHELVGLHVPSGRVVWRALTGEASRQVAIVNGVVVCATNERNTLRGMQPYTGQQIWAVQLEDVLKNGSFDGFEGAHALTGRGHFVVFECENGNVYAADAVSGRMVLRQHGKLGCHTLDVPGLVCIRDDEDFDKRTFTVLDLYQNRIVYQGPDEDIGMAFGAGKVAFFHFDPPKGTHVTVLDLQSRQIVARASVKSGSECPMTNQVDDDVDSGIILENGRILKGRRYSEELFIIDVARRQCIVQPPPRPGLVFWQLVRFQNLVFAAYKQKDGSPRVTISVWAANSLSQYGVLEGFGGYDAPRIVMPATTGLLVGKTAIKEGMWKRNNPVSWLHLDPATGQPITEYPVPVIGNVEVHGKFFCAMGTYYGNSFPVVYNTEQHARVL